MNNALSVDTVDSLELLLLEAYREEAERVRDRECDVGEHDNPALVCARKAIGFADRLYLDARYTVPLNEKLFARRQFCQRLIADTVQVMRPKIKQLVLWDWAAEVFDGNGNNRKLTDAQWIGELMCDRRSFYRAKFGRRKGGKLLQLGAVAIMEEKFAEVLTKVKAALEREGILRGERVSIDGADLRREG
jgi:hypothetical protein